MIKKLLLLVVLASVLVSGAFIGFRVSEAKNVRDNIALTADANK